MWQLGKQHTLLCIGDKVNFFKQHPHVVNNVLNDFTNQYKSSRLDYLEWYKNNENHLFNLLYDHHEPYEVRETDPKELISFTDVVES